MPGDDTALERMDQEILDKLVSGRNDRANQPQGEPVVVDAGDGLIWHRTPDLLEWMLWRDYSLETPFALAGVMDGLESMGITPHPSAHPELNALMQDMEPSQLRMLTVVSKRVMVMVVNPHAITKRVKPVWFLHGMHSRLAYMGKMAMAREAISFWSADAFLPDPFCRSLHLLAPGRRAPLQSWWELIPSSPNRAGWWTNANPNDLPPANPVNTSAWPIVLDLLECMLKGE